MIHQPPIDKLVDIVGNRYTLATLVAKRARQILESDQLKEDPSIKPISVAAEEIYEGKLSFTND